MLPLRNILASTVAAHLMTVDSPANLGRHNTIEHSEPAWLSDVLGLPVLVKERVLNHLSVPAYVQWTPVLLGTDPIDVLQLSEKAGSTNEWFAHVPLEATNAISETLAGLGCRRSATGQAVSSRTGTSPNNNAPGIDCTYLQSKLGAPLLNRTQWKYVNLNRVSPIEIFRYFSVAQMADISTLMALATMASTVLRPTDQSRTVPPVDYSPLNLGLDLNLVEHFALPISTLYSTSFAIMLNMALWRLYREGNTNQLHVFLFPRIKRGSPGRIYQAFPFIKGAINFMLTLGIARRDTPFVESVSQHWFESRAPRSGQNGTETRAAQQAFYECLRVNGFADSFRTNLGLRWRLTDQNEEQDSLKCAKVNFGSRWLRVKPNGDVLLGYFAPHFVFNEAAIVEVSPADTVLPVINLN
ncbi:hypothetical protein BJ085DRAFT_39284 [Dimargaris cristalligena]|uniref:Uncharacterized protein n=1 Tax=Dimargaris cristalligena TaxID=215637 RepID=A0A4P9ZLW3_9FUNG|nr:hypothetical protein BJ085DRAFT_39284 [Dimargaris cristalligena]|eukprot:RKP34304.1 hypothetical protein BJ085DRAFT_39284 [Dimargaris cristalligena]